MQVSRNLLIFASLALLPTSPAAAAALPIDSCQESCLIENNEFGNPRLFCTCKEASKKLIQPSADPFPRNFSDSSKLQEARLKGQSEADISAVAADACKPQVEYYRGHPRAHESAKQFLDNSTPNLCECVANRVHYPVKRRCERTRAFENTCTFSLDGRIPADQRPLRDPTLEDYQSCLLMRADAKVDENNCAVPACAEPPECGEGTELVNLAVSSACCPKYSCRPIGQTPEETGSAGSSAR